MPLVPDFGFCGEAYPSISPLLDAQDSINLIPEPGLATSKAKFALVNAPGLVPALTLSMGPVRALYSDYETMWAVAGSNVYEINPATLAIPNTYVLAGSGFGSTGFAQIVSNGVQLLVSDWSTGTIMLIDLGTHAVSVPPIIGPQWYAAIEYLDGFFYALDGTRPNTVLQSAPLDGTTWPGLNVAQRTGAPDKLVMLAEVNRQLLMMGVKKTEVWYDAGNPQFALQSGGGGTTIDMGVLVPQTVVRVGNSLMWVSGDSRGAAQVVMLNGVEPIRVSNYAIEYLLRKEFLNTYVGVTAFSYQEAGHLYYVLNTQNLTLVYDLTTKMWHRRGYWTGSAWTRGRVECFTAVNDGNRIHHFAGDYQNGNLYTQQAVAFQDGMGGIMTLYRISPHVSDNDQWLTHHDLSVYCTAAAAGGTLLLDYSDDGGQTFINQRTLEQQTFSSPEDTANYVWYRTRQLGTSRDRVYRLICLPGVAPFAIVNARLEAS